MAVNKVVRSDGTTLMDISPTTATAADVASGKVFFAANGVQTTGTASGSSGGASGLAGKNVIFFGDSISYGEGNNGHSYVDIIDEMGICASLVKEAHTSSCVGPYQVYQDGAGYDLIAMIETQATNIPNADIIFCGYSGNDSHAVSVGNVQLGYSTDASTATTVCGYMRKAINRIRELNPKVRICWLFHELADFKPQAGFVADNDWFVTTVKAMSDVCEKLNVTFMGLYAGLNLDYVNGHLVNDTAKHPNEAGQELIAENVLYNYPYNVRPYVPKKVVTLESDGTYDSAFERLLLMVSHDIDVTIDYDGILFHSCSYTSTALTFKSETVTNASSKMEYNLVITSSGATLYTSTSSISAQPWDSAETWDVIYDGTATIVADNPNYISLGTAATIGADETWRVNWNGTEFICPTSYGAAVSGYWFGNPAIAGGQDDGSGATFLAYKPDANSLAIGTTDGAGNISLKIEKRVS